jgi:hypothetical protein
MKQGMGESLLGLIGGSAASSNEQEGALKVRAGAARRAGRGQGRGAGALLSLLLSRPPPLPAPLHPPPLPTPPHPTPPHPTPPHPTPPHPTPPHPTPPHPYLHPHPPTQILGSVDEKTDGIIIINAAGIIMAVNKVGGPCLALASRLHFACLARPAPTATAAAEAVWEGLGVLARR